MNVDWDLLTKLIPAAVSAVVAVVGLSRGPSTLRSGIRHDAETLKNLPEGGPAAKALEDLIVKQLEALDAATSPGVRRDWPMFVVSLVTTPILGWLTIDLIQRGDWVWNLVAVVTGVFALLFLYGMFETAQKIPRDKAGKAVDTRGSEPLAT